MSPIPSPWRADTLTAHPPGPPWLVEGLIPGVGATELFGPPKAGKTHIISSLLTAVARGAQEWQGWPLRALPTGDVWWVTAELSDKDAAARLLDRTGHARPPRLVIQTLKQAVAGLGERRKEVSEYQYVSRRLVLTSAGAELNRIWRETPPALVAIDSATALISGFSAPNPESAITLATGLDTWARTVGCPFLITAHTSQDSLINWRLPDRLGYSARTGSQGIAGGYAAMLGVASWRPSENEDDARLAAIDLARGKTICLAQAAIRDGEEHWDPYHPAVFRHDETGFGLVRRRIELTKPTKRSHATRNEREGTALRQPAEKNGGWRHDEIV